MATNLVEEIRSEFQRVSVVIPIYNGANDLPDLVDCLWRQTISREQVEYLLVDNNSSDRTADLLQAAVEESRIRGIQMRSLQETNIQSSYAARNVGIKAAVGNVIAFVDADCRPRHDWLEQLTAPFADPEVGIVVGEVSALPSRNLFERYAERQSTLSQTHTLAHPFYPYGQTANLAIRRNALEEVGLFRPYMTTGGDADLCWRIQQQTAWQIRFSEQAIVNHRHRSTLGELRRQWYRYGCSNRYLHELHGVELMRELTLHENIYRWSRWLLKELPIVSIRIITRKTDADSLLDTPLGLLCAWARSDGQRCAQLPEQAQYIESMLADTSTPSVDSSAYQS